jgi:hypothetical protein
MKTVKELKFKSDWNKDNLEECFKDRLQDRSVKLYVGLSSIFLSNVWWTQNNSFFKDKLVPLEVTTTLTLNHVVKFGEDPKATKPRNPVFVSIDYEIPWGYLDGASEGHLLMCGVGVVLFINHNHYIFIRYAPSSGSKQHSGIHSSMDVVKDIK